MYLKQTKDCTLTVSFTPEEVFLLQLELNDIADEYNQYMSNTNGEGDTTKFPFVLTRFAQAYVGGILQFVASVEEPECVDNIFGNVHNPMYKEEVQ